MIYSIMLKETKNKSCDCDIDLSIANHQGSSNTETKACRDKEKQIIHSGNQKRLQPVQSMVINLIRFLRWRASGKTFMMSELSLSGFIIHDVSE